MNRNFRSSKNLKQVPFQVMTQVKDDSGVLKLKIKNLQEQIELLKKTNLNIYIPISQKQQVYKQKQNKDQIIKRLKVQLLKEQQQNQSLKTSIKKLQKQKQLLKINHKTQINKLTADLEQAQSRITQLQNQNEELQDQYQQEKEKKQLIEKDLIEIQVQLRFLKQDLQSYKTKYQSANKNYNQIKTLVLQVEFNSKIYQANKLKITAIQTSQLVAMKNSIFQLQKQVHQLLWKLANPKKQQKILLNIQTKNVAQEIVKLKKNIDLQLGFKGDQSLINSFLDKYSSTSQTFQQLIQGCKAPKKITQLSQKQ